MMSICGLRAWAKHISLVYFRGLAVDGRIVLTERDSSSYSYWKTLFSGGCLSGKYRANFFKPSPTVWGFLKVCLYVCSEMRETNQSGEGEAHISLKRKLFLLFKTHSFFFSLRDIDSFLDLKSGVLCFIGPFWCTKSSRKWHMLSTSSFVAVSLSSCSSHWLFPSVQTLRLHDLFKPLLWFDPYFWHLSCLDFPFVRLPDFPFVVFCTRDCLYPSQRLYLSAEIGLPALCDFQHN